MADKHGHGHTRDLAAPTGAEEEHEAHRPQEAKPADAGHEGHESHDHAAMIADYATGAPRLPLSRTARRRDKSHGLRDRTVTHAAGCAPGDTLLCGCKR